MTHPTRQVLPAIRFCGSCCVTLSCWALWLGLSTTLVSLIYMAVSHELPVPGFVLRSIEAHLTQANLTVEFGRAQIDPAGKLVLHDVRVLASPYPEPILTSRLVYVRVNFWSLIGPRELPTEIRLEGATVRLPAMLSPSGTSEPLVSDLALVLRPEKKIWHLDQFTARLGRLRVTAQGDYAPARRLAGTPPLDLAALVRQGLRHGPSLLLSLHQLEACEIPALAVRLAADPTLGNTAHLLFTTPSVQVPGGIPAILDSVALTTTLPLDISGAADLNVQAHIARLRYATLATAEHLNAEFTVQPPAPTTPGRITQARITTGRITADQEAILGLIARANLTDWPTTVHASTALSLAGEFLTADITAQPSTKTAHIIAAGRGEPTIINRVLGRHLPRAALFFVFGDPIDFTAEATLGPGWRFATLASRVAAGRIDSRGVLLTAARGRVDINGMDFLAHDAHVTLAEAEAHGSYWMNFSSSEYRMLLAGQLRPTDIQGWFNGPWWAAFWNDHFAFPLTPPIADVDVSGYWRDPVQTLFYGHAETAGARVWGGDFEHAQATIFLRPNFTHVIAGLGTQAGGARRLTGSLKRFTNATTRETNRLEFDATGNLDPESYRRMLAGKGDAVIDLLKFSTPPTVRAQGSLDGIWPALDPHFTFTGETTAPLHFSGFPLERASVRGRLEGNQLDLEDIRFGLAKGEGSGQVTLGLQPAPNRLRFNFSLDKADLGPAIRAFEEYQTNRTGIKTISATEGEFIKKAAAGHLSLVLKAQGNPDDLLHLSGSGHAALTGAELGEIPLFGPLSQLLKGLSINFSSLKFDAAHSSVRMDGGHLWFPDLKVTGHSAVIDAKGDLALATNTLNFTARFKPYEENRNILTAAIGLVLNPLTSILELKLTGPLSKPDWSMIVGASDQQPVPPPVTKPATVVP